MQVLRRFGTVPAGKRRAQLPLVLLLALGWALAGCGGAEEDLAALDATTTSSTDTTDPSAATTVPEPTTTGAGSATTLTVAPPRTTATTKPKPRPTVTTADPNRGFGAPFDIPAIVATQGFSKSEAREVAKNAFDKACAADPCRITLVDVDPRPDPAMAHCEIVFTGRTSPAAGTTVRRGSVVKLLFMYSNACDPIPP